MEIIDKYCPKCGTKIEGKTSFCPECGARLDNNYSNGMHQKEASDKNKLTAGLLAIFLGSLGIHYFYLGKSTAGILSIILSLCSCGIWSLLMFVQGIVMLTLSDEDFTRKYVNTDKSIPLF